MAAPLALTIMEALILPAAILTTEELERAPAIHQVEQTPAEPAALQEKLIMAEGQVTLYAQLR